MNSDFIGLIRAVLFMVILFVIVILCAAEIDKEEYYDLDDGPQLIIENNEPMVKQEDGQRKIIFIKASSSASEPSVPVDGWQSLGTFTLTAYCPCEKCCGYWATIRPTDEQGNPIVYTSIGNVAKPGTTIAVDPSVIPYGTPVKINDHIYIAEDTGGLITDNHIDIYFDDHQEALEFGVQTAEVFIKIK